MTDNNVFKSIEISKKELEPFLNNYIVKEFCKFHNIKEDNVFLNLKQENVARSSLFLDVKKKYILNVVNAEGVPVDILDIKGMVSNRSDYPPYTKDKIKELLILIISGDSINPSAIKKFVEETKKEIVKYLKAGDLRVGRPVYYSKKFEDYKKVPTHVLGMEFWNKYNYKIFEPGVKGYMFRLKSIDFTHPSTPEALKKDESKLKYEGFPNYICVPAEEEKCPEYYNLDIEENLNFCWNERVTEIIKAIGSSILENKKTF